jgi:hypothetical protein
MIDNELLAPHLYLPFREAGSLLPVSSVQKRSKRVLLPEKDEPL